MRVRAGARVPGLPDARAPAEALRGGGARRAGDPAAGRASSRRDVVVNDVLTLAPALAAELEGRPWATLVPHFYPPFGAGLPPFGLGAMPAAGARSAERPGGSSRKPMGIGVERGRRELNETRRRVGLPSSRAPTAGSATSCASSGRFRSSSIRARGPRACT